MATTVTTPPAAAVSAGGSGPLAWWTRNKELLKSQFKRYGYLAVATYLGVYVITLAGLFVLVRSGAVQGPDVNAFLNTWSVKRALYAGEVRISPQFVDFGTAWVLTKTTEPLRLVATIALVPAIVRRAPPAVLHAFRVAAAASSLTPEMIAADAAAKAAAAAASASAAALAAYHAAARTAAAAAKASLR